LPGFPLPCPLPRLPVARRQKWRAAPWHDVCTHNVGEHSGTRQGTRRTQNRAQPRHDSRTQTPNRT
jgi:hypothetical protein